MPAMFSKLLNWLGTLLIVAIGLFALLLALGAHLQLLEARKLMSQGRQTEGMVTEAHGGGKRSTSYYFSYEFPAGNVKHARKNRSIAYGDYTQMRPGTRIQVWYDPANPERSITTPELAEHESWANRLFFPLVGLALLGWGVARIVRRPRPPAPPAAPAHETSPIRRGD